MDKRLSGLINGRMEPKCIRYFSSSSDALDDDELEIKNIIKNYE